MALLAASLVLNYVDDLLETIADIQTGATVHTWTTQTVVCFPFAGSSIEAFRAQTCEGPTSGILAHAAIFTWIVPCAKLQV